MSGVADSLIVDLELGSTAIGADAKFNQYCQNPPLGASIGTPGYARTGSLGFYLVLRNGPSRKIYGLTAALNVIVGDPVTYPYSQWLH